MATYAIASLLREHRAPADVALAWIQALTTLAGPRPAHAMWLRVPPAVAARRAAERAAVSRPADRPEHRAYLNWVNYAYELLAEHDQQLTVLDVTDLDPRQAHEVVHRALSRYSDAIEPVSAECAGLHHLAGRLS
jgi:thymidylate kinase